VDLAEWYAAGRWVGLLDLIDQLPTASRLNGARLNDPEEALRIAQLPKSTEEWAPLVSEYDATFKILARMADTLSAISQQIVGASGGKPSTPKQVPTPRTEVERLSAELEREAGLALAARFGIDESYF
jgi:hypothetical protein